MLLTRTLPEVLQSLDPGGWSEEKVSLLLEAADINGDGRIQYNEFVEWVAGFHSHLSVSIAPWQFFIIYAHYP